MYRSYCKSIPMAAQPKAWVCNPPLAGIAGSIPAGGGGGAWMFASCECVDRGLCDGQSLVRRIPAEGLSLSVIKRNNNTLHVQRKR